MGGTNVLVHIVPRLCCGIVERDVVVAEPLLERPPVPQRCLGAQDRRVVLGDLSRARALSVRGVVQGGRCCERAEHIGGPADDAVPVGNQRVGHGNSVSWHLESGVRR